MRVMAGPRGQMRNLDDQTELAAAINDPVGFILTSARPLFIDEVQRGGEPLIRAVKAEVDRDPRPGQFVLAGSTRFLSEPTLGESLAGRAGFVEVLPFSEGELAGQSETFLELAYDAPESLRDLGPATLERRDCDLSRATVERYIELLDAVFLTHRLSPWSRNPLTRAVKHPKAYVLDTGLLCHLLGTNANSLSNPTSPHLGAVAETFVVNELRKQAGWSSRLQLFITTATPAAGRRSTSSPRRRMVAS